jgi:hypothetical protein
MRSLYFAAILLAASTLIPVALPAQCGGYGPASFEFISVDNQPIGPGSKVILRLRAEPGVFFCLLCDTGPGPKQIPVIGTVCLDLSPNLVEFVAQIPPSGVLDIPVTIPNVPIQVVICCQWFGVQPTNLQISLSNAVCTTLNQPCAGGVNEIGLFTQVDKPASFPAVVTATAKGRQGANSQSFKTDVTFNPATPPKFPVTDDGFLFIEKIVVNGDKLDVFFRVAAGFDGQTARRVNNEMLFTAHAGQDTNSQQIHCSCSQPIGVGMVFGDFRVTKLVPRNFATQ